MTYFFTRPLSSLTDLRPPLRITQKGPPPLSDAIDEGAYKRFPLNVAQVLNLGLTGTTTSAWSHGIVQTYQWCMRTQPPPFGESTRTSLKANQYDPPVVLADGTMAGMIYSTFDNADAATLTRLAWSVGRSDYASYAAGMTVYTVPDFAAVADSLCTTIDSFGQKCAVNLVVLPDARLEDCTNERREVAWDGEWQDGRTHARQLALFTAAGKICHSRGYKLEIYTNPLDGGTAPYNGYSAPLDDLLAPLDYFDIFAYHAPNDGASVYESVLRQIAMFDRPDFSKLQILFDIQGALSDAVAVRGIIRRLGLPGVILFPSPDGSDPDQCAKIAALLGLEL